MVGLSHVENMARGTSGDVPNHNETAGQQAVTNDPRFTVVLARVLDLDGSALEYDRRVLEVQATFDQGSFALGWVEGDAHRLL